MGNQASVADELPVLYRTILDRVALLERAGSRREAGRIRAAATRAYSTAWDERHLHRLEALADRASALLAGSDAAPDASPDRAPGGQGRRRYRWWSVGLG
jgi:hypothetical protein